MGRKATKAQSNVWYQARIDAAKMNERLASRMGAAEELGISEDAIKAAELGLYKAMPVENAVLMADAYNAPELLNYYCLNECPIGAEKPLSCDVLGIEQVTVKLLKNLRTSELLDLKERLLDIAEDGEVSAGEIPDLQACVDYLDSLSRTASELKIIADRIRKMRGG